MSTSTAQPIAQSVKAQFDSHVSFFSDTSAKMFDGMRRIIELNMQVARAVLAESAVQGKELLHAESAPEYMTKIAAQIKPVAEKACMYQQHVADIASDVQGAIAQSIGQHAQAIGQQVVQDTIVAQAMVQSEQPGKAATSKTPQ